MFHRSGQTPTWRSQQKSPLTFPAADILRQQGPGPLLPWKLTIVTEGPWEFLDMKEKGRDRKAGRASLTHMARVACICSSAVRVTAGCLQVELTPPGLCQSSGDDCHGAGVYLKPFTNVCPQLGPCFRWLPQRAGHCPNRLRGLEEAARAWVTGS